MSKEVQAKCRRSKRERELDAMVIKIQQQIRNRQQKRAYRR